MELAGTTRKSIVRETLPLFWCAIALMIGFFTLSYRLRIYEKTITIALPINGIQTWSVPYFDLAGLATLFVLLLSFAAVVIMGRIKPGAELTPVAITAMLSGIGLIFLARLGPVLIDRYREGPYEWLVFKQALWITVGIAWMAWLACKPRGRHYLLLVDRKYLLALIGSCLIVLTAVYGKDINGRRLWLSIGGFQFQTIEFVKPLLVFFAAGYFAEKLRLAEHEKRALNPGIVLPFALMVVVSLFPIFLQGDLGPTFLLFCVFLAMFYMATSAEWPVGLATLASAGAAMAMYLAHWPQMLRTRIDMWLEPFSRCEHVAESIWAISSGGLLGAGLGGGMPQCVPIVYSDFIFSAVAEELGFAGVLLMLSLFAGLSVCGYKIALQCGEPVQKFIAAGITTILSIQAITILGGVSGLLPVTGITLPFVSYGGSAMVTNFGMLGILINISSGCDERE